MIEFALLGATGLVGQKVLELIHYHPEYRGKFKVKELVASQRNWGKAYKDVVDWKMSSPIMIGEDGFADITIKDYQEITTKLVVSALPSQVAIGIEKDLSSKGFYISSNASNDRLHPEVPLVLSGVNHLNLQKVFHIIKNPNCVVAVAATALKPIVSHFPVESIHLVSLQAASGAGYPGVPSLDLIGNTIPYIAGEEEKLSPEINKILSSQSLKGEFPVYAQCHRVAVSDGHMVSMQIVLSKPSNLKEIRQILDDFAVQYGLIKIWDNPSYPQVKLHISSMENRVHIGRLKLHSNGRILSMVALGHNLVRGAASIALDNLSLFKQV